jgi:ferrochelatase
MAKKGVLFVNLGTPDSAKPKAVWRYLTEFLKDPRVIDIPALARWILVNVIVIPFRFKKSAHAYAQIWTEQGSPLLTNTQELSQKVGIACGQDYQVEFAMRYGKPSIESVLKTFKSVNSLQIIPLFPQYSSAATGSAIEAVLSSLKKQWNIPHLTICKEFYATPVFIDSYAQIIKKHITNQTVDKLIFSYHGLPQRHLTKSDCTASCDHVNACPAIEINNQYCYRAQCYVTSRLLAQKLNLSDDAYEVCFQSRLGRTPWIKPYTDLVLPELRAQGVKSIAIVCPSFVADCLETLEEINLRAREQWAELGGEHFTFIPCLNADDVWVDALTKMITTSN